MCSCACVRGVQQAGGSAATVQDIRCSGCMLLNRKPSYIAAQMPLYKSALLPSDSFIYLGHSVFEGAAVEDHRLPTRTHIADRRTLTIKQSMERIQKCQV